MVICLSTVLLVISLLPLKAVIKIQRYTVCLGLPTVPYFPGHPVFRPMCPASRLMPSGTQNVPFFRMHVKQICGVGNKLIIRLQTHHTSAVSLVRNASSVYLLGSSWGIAKLVCFHATTMLLLTYSWIGD